MTDERLVYPATARNRDAILAVLRRALPAEGAVLEIASGSGEHAAYLAPHFPGLRWQPTDVEPAALASIRAWAAHAAARNVADPCELDVTRHPWPVRGADAVVCINMVHIAPWEATLGLLRGASTVLPAGGLLYLYGPYRREGVPTAPSNEAFDASLRARDPRWGVRDLDAVVAAGGGAFVLDDVVAMPANNLSVLLRRA